MRNKVCSIVSIQTLFCLFWRDLSGLKPRLSEILFEFETYAHQSSIQIEDRTSKCAFMRTELLKEALRKYIHLIHACGHKNVHTPNRFESKSLAFYLWFAKRFKPKSEVMCRWLCIVTVRWMRCEPASNKNSFMTWNRANNTHEIYFEWKRRAFGAIQVDWPDLKKKSQFSTHIFVRNEDRQKRGRSRQWHGWWRCSSCTLFILNEWEMVAVSHLRFVNLLNARAKKITKTIDWLDQRNDFHLSSTQLIWIFRNHQTVGIKCCTLALACWGRNR